LDKTSTTYGKTLFELALEENALDAVGAQLELVQDALEMTPGAKELLLHSRLSKETKKDILKAALADLEDSLLYNFVMVLIDKDRAEFLEGIIAAYRQFVNEHLQIAQGVVVSAVPLSDLQQSQLAAKLSLRLKQEVKLSNTVDPTLLGGYRVVINGKVFDNSLKFQLSQLKNKLMSVDLNKSEA